MSQIDNDFIIKSEAFQKKLHEKISRFTLMDDAFFMACFANDLACTEFILKILLDKDDLTVTKATTQYTMKNIHGHSSTLDVLAIDSNHIHYNIEVQRNDEGADPKRARYYSSLIDSNTLPPGTDYSLLTESYVIFITENDVLKKGRPIYHIDRTIAETGDNFGDDSHIIYVNAAFVDDSQLGKLMQDFQCANPNNMNYPILAQKTRLFKEDTKGEKQSMYKITEELLEEFHTEIEQMLMEARAETKAEIKAKAEAQAQAEQRDRAISSAFDMLKDGLEVERVAKYTSLPIDEVKKYAALLAN